MPWGSGLFPLLIITSSGGFTGLFEYSPAPGKGNLILSSTASNGTDPFGNKFYQGLATYSPSGGSSFVITLLSTAQNALFQYNTPSGGVQGILILSVSASGGASDPVTGVNYQPGLYGIDPAFGDTLQTVGANIHFGQVAYTRTADVVAAAAPANNKNPYLVVDAPEQTTAAHMQMLLQGASPDATRQAQALIGQVAGAGILAPDSQAMVEIQGGTSQSVMSLVAHESGDNSVQLFVSGDTQFRFVIDTSGTQSWGSGSAVADCSLQRGSANLINFTTCDVAVHTVGRGLRVATGANAKMGTAVLVAGTVTVSTTAVTANSGIYVGQHTPGGTVGAPFVSTVTVGTSFVIKSTSATDTSTVAWIIFEPG